MVHQARYKPFGEVRWHSGSSPTDFTFTGQRTEGGYGINGSAGSLGRLMDYNARMYSPVLGRFISADSIVPGAGNPQAFNRYSYVNNRPLSMIDPSGHTAIPCPLCSIFGSFQQGFAHRHADNMSLGVLGAAEQAAGYALAVNHESAFRAGESAADVFGVLQGISEVASGLGMIVGGTGGAAVCTVGTAGACGVVAVPAAAAVDAAGAGIMGHGIGMMMAAGSGRSGAGTVGPRPSQAEVKKHIGRAPDIGKFGDKGFMDWGNSPRDAYNRSKTITREQINDIKLGKSDAEWGLNFYKDERLRNPANIDLHDSRIFLMETVLKLLE